MRPKRSQVPIHEAVGEELLDKDPRIQVQTQNENLQSWTLVRQILSLQQCRLTFLNEEEHNTRQFNMNTLARWHWSTTQLRVSKTITQAKQRHEVTTYPAVKAAHLIAERQVVKQK